MRKLISMAAVSAAATLGLLAPAQAAQADPGGQLLGNTATGLCVTRTAGPVDPPRPAYTAPCTGASTQR